MAKAKALPRPEILVADRAVLAALKSMDSYAPRNPVCTTESLQQLEAEVQRANENLRVAEQALEAARNHMFEASWAFHHASRLARSEVIVQFGEDSTALRAVGLTPRSARKRPTRRKVVVTG